MNNYYKKKRKIETIELRGIKYIWDGDPIPVNLHSDFQLTCYIQRDNTKSLNMNPRNMNT